MSRIRKKKITEGKWDVPDRTINGFWRFAYTGAFEDCLMELAILAEALHARNPGGGEYKRLYISDTTDDEVSIFFTYKLGKYEIEPSENLNNWKRPYLQFFAEFGFDAPKVTVSSSIFEMNLFVH